MTDNSSQTPPPHEDPLGREFIEVVFEASFAAIILLSSILANSMILYVINTNPNLKTFINKVIGNLCIVDLVEAFLVMPLWIVNIVKGRWIFGSVICNVSGFLFVAIANGILYFLMLIAVSRYFKVVKPHLYNRIFVGNKRRSRIFLGLCWTLPIIISCPPLFGWGGFVYNPKSCLCEYEWSLETLNITYMAFLVAAQPSPYIICWCYIKIYNSVRKNRIQICSRKNRSACQNAHNAESTFIQLTLGIACGVVVCWLPKAILILMMVAGKQELSLPLRIASYLGFLVCCLNPVIYGLINPQFKPAFKALFKRRTNENSQIECGVLSASVAFPI